MTTELAVPLGDRVEFLSPGYFASMQEVVAKANGSYSPFSYSLNCENPPGHLSSTSLGYTLRFTPEGVALDETSDPGADLLESIDYNAALWLHSIVTRGNIESAGRRRSEYESLFGVQLANVPAGYRPFLTDMIDALAIRTINNPDIDHRIRSFGLDKHIADFNDTGYTVFENAFSDDFADQLREEAARNHAGREDGASFRATMLLQRGGIWEEAALHPWVLTAADYLLGRGCLMYQSDTIVKKTGQETHPGLHSDYGASRIAEPFPDFCILSVAVWAIDDFKAENGPTVIMPGSFRERRQVPAGTTQEGTTSIEMSQGSIAMWHGATWHGSTPRTAPGTRTSLHNAYCRNFVRPIEGYRDIDPEIIQRNPPALSTLCGLDDPFGKSGDDGADFERLKYCAQAGYGQSTPLSAWNENR